jgi:hypothetical protein
MSALTKREGSYQIHKSPPVDPILTSRTQLTSSHTNLFYTNERMDRFIVSEAQLFRIQVRSLLCEQAAVCSMYTVEIRRFTAFQPKCRYNIFLYKQLLGVRYRISNLLMSI